MRTSFLITQLLLKTWLKIYFMLEMYMLKTQNCLNQSIYEISSDVWLDLFTFN